MELRNAGQVRRGEIRITPEWQRLIEVLHELIIEFQAPRCAESGSANQPDDHKPTYPRKPIDISFEPSPYCRCV